MPTETEAIVEAYRGYWIAVMRASDPPNPDHPDLAQYAIDPALGTMRDTIADLQGSGLVQRGDMGLEPEVTSVDGDRATVEDCVIDSGVVYSASGSVVVPAKTDAVAVTEVLVRTPEGWKVTEVEIGGSCTR